MHNRLIEIDLEPDRLLAVEGETPPVRKPVDDLQTEVGVALRIIERSLLEREVGPAVLHSHAGHGLLELEPKGDPAVVLWGRMSHGVGHHLGHHQDEVVRLVAPQGCILGHLHGERARLFRRARRVRQPMCDLFGQRTPLRGRFPDCDDAD